jgi:hypothetical protein
MWRTWHLGGVTLGPALWCHCEMLLYVTPSMTSWLNRIDRILIPPRYTFFSGSPPTKNYRVKRV